MAIECAPIRLIIFNWGGVLKDDRKVQHYALSRMLELYGKPKISFEEWLPDAQAGLGGFLQANGIEADDFPKMKALYKGYMDEAAEAGVTGVVTEDTYAVLRHFKEKGKMLAVLSGRPVFELCQDISRCDRDYNYIFNYMTLRGGVRKGGSLEEELGLLWKHRFEKEEAQKEVLYVGDTARDIRAAKSAGVLSAGVCSGHHPRERLEREEPDFLFERLLDMIGEKALR